MPALCTPWCLFLPPCSPASCCLHDDRVSSIREIYLCENTCHVGWWQGMEKSIIAMFSGDEVTEQVRQPLAQTKLI